MKGFLIFLALWTVGDAKFPIETTDKPCWGA